MKIQSTSSKTWDNKPPEFKQTKYPVPNDPEAPRLYPVILAVGSRGSGKTFSLTKIIQSYLKNGIRDPQTGKVVPQRVVIFSPTYQANNVLKTLPTEQEDVHETYSESALQALMEDLADIKHNALEYQRVKKLLRKHVRSEANIGEQQDLAMNMGILEHPPKYKVSPVTHILFDDLVGAGAFKQAGKSVLNNLTLRNRHHGLCMYFATQSLKQFPRMLRQNVSCFLLYKYSSAIDILKDFHIEVSAMLTLEQLEALYEFAVRDDHDFLFFDSSQPKDRRIRRNFAEYLTITQ